MEISVDIFKRLNIETPFDIAMPLFGTFLEEIRTAYYSDAYILMFTAVQFPID